MTIFTRSPETENPRQILCEYHFPGTVRGEYSLRPGISVVQVLVVAGGGQPPIVRALARTQSFVVDEAASTAGSA